jgi:phage baseplate assembly protein W
MALFGPQWPLSRGERNTFKIYTDPKDQINFFLKNLLLTSKGENLSDLNYGVGIRRFLFEMNLPSSLSIIESEISEQIGVYLPYLTIDDISVSSSSTDVDNGATKVRIVYSIPKNIIQAVFELEINQETIIGFY